MVPPKPTSASPQPTASATSNVSTLFVAPPVDKAADKEEQEEGKTMTRRRHAVTYTRT